MRKGRRKKTDIPLFAEEIRLKSQGSVTEPSSKKKSSKRKRHLTKGKLDIVEVEQLVELSPEELRNQKLQRLIDEAREDLESAKTEADAAVQVYNANVDAVLDQVKAVYTEYVVIDNKLKSLTDFNSNSMIFKDFKSFVRAVITGKVDPYTDELMNDTFSESSIRKFIRQLEAKEDVLLYEINVFRTDVLKCQKKFEKAEHRLNKLLSGKYVIDDIDTEKDSIIETTKPKVELKREAELDMYIERIAEREHYDNLQSEPKKSIAERFMLLLSKLKAMIKNK